MGKIKVISGGQTGVDRGALAAAIGLGLEHGGWCPRGRKAEDGAIPAIYHLEELESTRYADRTRRNVMESDGTLILCSGPLSGGTELTRRLALHRQKPCLVMDLDDPDPDSFWKWTRSHRIRVLNVAGPRESTLPGAQERSRRFLERMLSWNGEIETD